MILDAASLFINDRGAKGCTFQAVSEAAGLNTTSVTHYFARKELLAEAVFTRTLSRLAEMANEASREATPQTRVRRFLDLNIALRAAVIRGENLRLTTLSDVRTLDAAIRTQLELAFQQVFRIIRGFFGPSEGEAKILHTADAHVLLEAVGRAGCSLVGAIGLAATLTENSGTPLGRRSASERRAVSRRVNAHFVHEIAATRAIGIGCGTI